MCVIWSIRQCRHWTSIWENEKRPYIWELDADLRIGRRLETGRRSESYIYIYDHLWWRCDYDKRNIYVTICDEDVTTTNGTYIWPSVMKIWLRPTEHIWPFVIKMWLRPTEHIYDHLWWRCDYDQRNRYVTICDKNVTTTNGTDIRPSVIKMWLPPTEQICDHLW